MYTDVQVPRKAPCRERPAANKHDDENIRGCKPLLQVDPCCVVYTHARAYAGCRPSFLNRASSAAVSGLPVVSSFSP
jgi:hypothetical protein